MRERMQEIDLTLYAPEHKILGFLDAFCEDYNSYMQPAYEMEFTDIQVKAVIDTLQNPQVLWVTSRGGGKTLLNALINLMSTFFFYKVGLNGCFHSSVVSGSWEQTRQFWIYMNLFSKMPMFRDYISKVLTNRVKFTKELKESITTFYTCSDNSVRSPRADLLELDEVCYIPDDIIVGAIGQLNGSPIGKMCCMSTPKGIGTRVHSWSMDPEWIYVHYSYRVCPWITNRVLKLARSVMTAKEFRAEYGAEWVSLEGAVFDSDMLTLALETEPFQLNSSKHVKIGADIGRIHNTVYTLIESDDEHINFLDIIGGDWGFNQGYDELLKVLDRYSSTEEIEIYYEYAPISYKPVLDLKALLEECGYRNAQIVPCSYGNEKPGMINTMEVLLEHNRISMSEVRYIRKYIAQYYAYHYELDTRGNPIQKYNKTHDDAVDSGVFGVYGTDVAKRIGEIKHKLRNQKYGGKNDEFL